MDIYIYIVVAGLLIKAFWGFRTAEQKLGGMPKKNKRRKTTGETVVGSTVFGH